MKIWVGEDALYSAEELEGTLEQKQRVEEEGIDNEENDGIGFRNRVSGIGDFEIVDNLGN